jgi:hypothetical protein
MALAGVVCGWNSNVRVFAIFSPVMESRAVQLRQGAK